MAGTLLSGLTYQTGGLALCLGAALVLAGALVAWRRRARDVTPAPECAVSPRRKRDDVTVEDLVARGPYPP
jgi:hypothetical protein